MESWYTRPVFFVRDMDVALAFYAEGLGFEQGWRYEEEGRIVATQVRRADCELILNARSERAGGSRVFVSLEPDGVSALATELEARSVPITRGWWGMPVLQVSDPDGNDLLFPTGES